MLESWYRVRGYPHFDRRVSARFASSFVPNPVNIARHSFLPFIGYTKTVPRYRANEGRVEDKNRQILYASHLDGLIYAYYAQILSRQLDCVLSAEPSGHSVLAYRSLGKSNIDFANEAFDNIEASAPCAAMCFDITGFFDNMRHDVLKRAWGSLLKASTLPADHYAVFRSITRYSWVERKRVYEEFTIDAEALQRGLNRICTAAEFRECVRRKGLINTNRQNFGIPQGSPISAVLSNIYLLDFDRRMCQLANDIGGHYRRYSDDILWICPQEKKPVVEHEVVNAISDVHLKINLEKTETSIFNVTDDGRLHADRLLQYLGFTFDGGRRLIRSSTLANFYRRMRRAVRRAAQAAKLNPQSPRIFRRKLYRRFTHLGRHNFIAYAYRSAKKLNNTGLKRQLAKHWEKLHHEIERYEAED